MGGLEPPPPRIGHFFVITRSFEKRRDLEILLENIYIFSSKSPEISKKWMDFPRRCPDFSKHLPDTGWGEGGHVKKGGHGPRVWNIDLSRRVWVKKFRQFASCAPYP